MRSVFLRQRGGDGFHRVKACTFAERAEIDADVRQGTQRDAILYSVSANATHGMRRTNADKRRAVMTLLNDEQWSKWSDREIAAKCGVSNTFVGQLRKEVLPVNGLQVDRTWTTRHGTTATMNTANIGRTQSAAFWRVRASGRATGRPLPRSRPRDVTPRCPARHTVRWRGWPEIARESAWPAPAGWLR